MSTPTIPHALDLSLDALSNGVCSINGLQVAYDRLELVAERNSQPRLTITLPVEVTAQALGEVYFALATGSGGELPQPPDDGDGEAPGAAVGPV